MSAQTIYTENATSPTAPSSGQVSLYAKTDGNLYSKNPANVETLVTAGSAITQLTGDVDATGPGSVTATIQPNAVTNAKLAEAPEYTIKGNNTNATADVTDLSGNIIIGVPSFSDSGISLQLTGNQPSYFQVLNQNVNSGSSSSTDFVVSNNLGTDSTYYGDFGINSSTFTGTGSLGLADATYLYAANGDLAIGTSTPNAIHFVTDGSATDTMTMDDAGNVAFPNLTGFMFANGASNVTTHSSTGSGSVVLATSPTLVTPALGTPSSVVLTNATGLPLTSGVTGTLPISHGGTNATTANAAFDNLSPLTTAGDIIYENATPTATNLPIGTSGQVLTVVAGLPAWETPTDGTVTSISVVSANGFAGTVANPTTTPAITLETTLTTPVIAGNGTALIAATTTGTGSTVVLATSPTLVTPALGTPSSATLTNATGLPLTSGVTGVLPIANGGTGAATTSQNFAFIGPTSGSGAPSFRLLVAGDIPSSLPYVNTIGTIDSQTPSSNGLVTSGSDLYAQSASASDPGMVNNTTQTFSGNKTFSGQTAISNTSTDAFTVNSTSLVVDATNNAVGIGVQPATSVGIDIVNSSGTSKPVQITAYGSGSTAVFRGRAARGTAGSPTATQSGDILAVFSGRGYGSSSFGTSSTGVLNVVAGAAFTNISMPTFLQFEVTPTGSATPAEAMRINSTGNVLIATTTDSGTQVLQVNGNSNVGTVTAGQWNGTTTAGNSFLTSGTTYTTPSTISANTQFKFTLVAGGGPGASGNTSSEHSPSGGGAETVIVYATGLAASTAYTISIGAGATGAASGTTGSNGGNTTLVIGATTYTAHGGQAAAATAGAGGLGGSGGNGTINIPGQSGGASMSVFTSAGLPGGSSGLGWGAGGPGNPASAAANGQNAVGYGGGGGGASSNGAPTGGNGTSGCILVEWNN